MILALVALFVALGGTSYAAISIGSGNIRTGAVNSRTIKNNDIRGKDVRDRTLGSRDLGDSARPLRTYGPVALGINQSATLLTYGSFSVVAKCIPVAASTRFIATLVATENGSSFGSGSDDSGGIGPTTPEADRVLRQVTAPINQFRHSAGSSDAFSAVSNTRALEGTIHATANGQSRNCRAYGSYVRIK